MTNKIANKINTADRYAPADFVVGICVKACDIEASQLTIKMSGSK
jgi:hypothetical protein